MKKNDVNNILKMKRIGIIEDDLGFAETIRDIIHSDSAYTVEIVCHSLNEVNKNIDTLDLDLIILDIQLPDGNGIDILKKLKPIYPDTLFVMCTSFEDNERIYESIKNGAVGYILKSEALIVIKDSIHEAFRGGAPITAAIARKVLGFFRSMNHSEQKIHSLTPKESEILKLLSKGYLYKEIADIENNSAETIKKHIGNIYRKLGVSNKTEAANIYLNNSILNLV